MISARLAPLDRPISSRIFAPLLSARSVSASLACAVLAFLPARGSLLRCGGRRFALGTFLALGRTFLLGGVLRRGALLRRNVCALFRNGGGVSGIVASERASA
jgi:hypothetical protein